MEPKPTYTVPDKRAHLISFNRGFGGDTYEYRLEPALELDGVPISTVTVAVEWGLLAPMCTVITYRKHPDDTYLITLWVHQGARRVEAYEALARQDYRVVPVDPLTLLSSETS